MLSRKVHRASANDTTNINRESEAVNREQHTNTLNKYRKTITKHIKIAINTRSLERQNKKRAERVMGGKYANWKNSIHFCVLAVGLVQTVPQ